MNKVLAIALILSAIAAVLLYAAINALVPRYDDFPGGGICFHKPQEIVDHVNVPKPEQLYLDLLSAPR